MQMQRYRTTTALVAALALSFPQFPSAQEAMGENMMLLCLDGSEPPCPDDEFTDGVLRPADEVGVPIEDVMDEAGIAALLRAMRDMPDTEPVEDEEDIPGVEVEDPDIAADVEPEVEPADLDVDPDADPVELQEEFEAEAEVDPTLDADAEVALDPAPTAIDPAIDPEELDAEIEIDTEAEAEVNVPEAELDVPEAEPEVVSPAIEDEPVEAPVDPVDPAVDPVDPVEEPVTDPAVEPGPAPVEEPAMEEEVTEVDPATVPEAEGEVEVQATAAATDETAEPTAVVEDILDEARTRSSDEEFADTVDGQEVVAEPDAAERDSGLTNFQRALLLGLGAVAVGSLLDDGSQVVTSSGDRVVVERDGQLTVYKDDDAMLFRPGSNVRTETFADGSTRTFINREDGSQIVTIRDNQGQVLRRTRIDADGTQIRIFDDTIQYAPIDVTVLQAAAQEERTIDFSLADEQALREALAAETAYDAGRYFSLRQIRANEEVRSLVPSIDLDTINFATGSAAIPEGQARDLTRLGIAMEEMLEQNPREVFLVEGHTDAVGDAAYNLALSDRRAESVALALTEYFEIPPENLVVQGYGEQFLRIDTPDAEQANRRAVVRRITPLLQAAAAD
jgi:outer membrane protein OmpA-like peptidoglycan-associated protein